MIAAMVLVFAALIKYYLINLKSLNKVPSPNSSSVVVWYVGLLDKVLAKLPKIPSLVLILIFLLPLPILISLGSCGVYFLGGYVSWIVYNVLILYFILSKLEELDEGQLFMESQERILGIIFWFSLFGLMAGVLYWLLINRKILDNSQRFQACAQWLELVHKIAAWPSVRITGLLYALVGNFVSGFGCWFNCIKNIKMENDDFVQECGKSALGVNDETDTNASKKISALVYRTIFAWIALGVVFSLIVE